MNRIKSKDETKFTIINSVFISVFFVSMILFFGYASTSKGTSHVNLKPYKVGLICPLSGPAGLLGHKHSKVIAMLEEQVNKGGGINGHQLHIFGPFRTKDVYVKGLRGKYKEYVDPLVYDSRGDQMQVQNAIKKLAERDVLAILGPSLNSTTIAAIPLVEKRMIPLISFGESLEIVQPVKKWVFKTSQPTDNYIKKTLKHLNDKGIFKIATITELNDFGSSTKNKLNSLASKYGVTVVLNIETKMDDPHIISNLQKIMSSEAQAVISGVQYFMIDQLLKKRSILSNIPLFQFYGASLIDLSKGDADGLMAPIERLFVVDFLPEKDFQKRTLLEFDRIYKMSFQNEGDRYTSFETVAYDALLLLIDALKAVGPDRQLIRSYIENKKEFVGINGVFNFSSNDHNGLDEGGLIMCICKNKKWVLLE